MPLHDDLSRLMAQRDEAVFIMNQAKRDAEQRTREIKETLLERGMTDFLSVNWSALHRAIDRRII